MAGTAPEAPARSAKIKEMMGGPCAVLECAINSGVDYCLQCPKFPCDVHYQGIPYSKVLLNLFKKFQATK